MFGHIYHITLQKTQRDKVPHGTSTDINLQW